MSHLSSILSLRLHSFRSHALLNVDPQGRSLAIVGPNGSGKTNLLEAISLLSPGRGLNGATIGEMSTRGGGSFAVHARVCGEDLQTEIGTGPNARQDTRGRVVRIDGREVPVERLLDHVRIVWATPDLERGFCGEKGRRRSFLDRATMSTTPSHARSYVDMERALRNRSILLSNGAPDRLLDPLDRELSVLFAQVHANRTSTVSALAAGVAGRPDDAFPKSRMELSSGWSVEPPREEIEVFALDRLRSTRPAHRSAEMTLEGPHRADLSLYHAPKDMPISRCSTGEQKALTIGLVLAQAASVAATGDPPVLLLDEICSHLDNDRRRDLFVAIRSIGCQTFATGTDETAFVDMDADRLTT